MKISSNKELWSNKWFPSIVVGLVIMILGILLLSFSRNFSILKGFLGRNGLELEFDSQRAYLDVEYQVDLGPRIPGTEAHRNIQEWVVQELWRAGWKTEIQNTVFENQPISNIVGKFGQGYPWIVLGAHYDTRIHADLDPDVSKTLEPVPGANDGGSGVAVLLELARQFPKYFRTLEDSKYEIEGTVWLVFFDAEDNGRIEGWDWILGSRAFVRELDSHPDAAVILDMIGDRHLNIYQEENSDDRLTQEIWDTAEELGYDGYFIPYEKYAILDDHIPFLEAGIPAVDIIDWEYAYWHSTADTPDKVAPESLEVVGKTLLAWLLTQY